jgi:hypothetical protein
MNLVVVLANGAMPVATTADQITDDERPSYRPIDQSTRLRWLADWIDVGWAYFSPGDFLLIVAALGIVVRSLVQILASQ